MENRSSVVKSTVFLEVNFVKMAIFILSSNVASMHTRGSCVYDNQCRIKYIFPPHILFVLCDRWHIIVITKRDGLGAYSPHWGNALRKAMTAISIHINWLVLVDSVPDRISSRSTRMTDWYSTTACFVMALDRSFLCQERLLVPAPVVHIAVWLVQHTSLFRHCCRLKLSAFRITKAYSKISLLCMKV